MSKHLLGSVALAAALVAGPAMAADMAVYKAPPVFSWSGCYIGATGGYVRNRTDFSWDFGPAFPDTAAFIAGRRAGAEARFETDDFTFGGEIGCQQQFGALVIGVEIDAQWMGGSGDRFVDLTNFGLPAGNNLSESFDQRWLSTGRARVGWAVDRALLYVTGGVAAAQVRYSDFTNYPAAAQGFSHDMVHMGWVAGGGVEYAFTNTWSVKAEYLHVDLRTVGYQTQAFTLAGAPVANAFLYHNHTLVSDIVRVGINWRWCDCAIIAKN